MLTEKRFESISFLIYLVKMRNVHYKSIARTCGNAGYEMKVVLYFSDGLILSFDHLIYPVQLGGYFAEEARLV